MSNSSTSDKVLNGYGNYTSKLSISNIGCYNSSPVKPPPSSTSVSWQRRDDQEELSNQSKLKLTHPSKLNLHLQKCYPSTSARLAKGSITQLTTPRELKTGFTNKNPYNVEEYKQKCDFEFKEAGKRTRKEAEWNYNKRIYNKSRSSNAEVNLIMRGEPEISSSGKVRTARYPLFPQNATHDQLLNIDHNYFSSDASIEAPLVKKGYKWLGAAVGWEGNRGLVASRREFEDGRVDVWPDIKREYARASRSVKVESMGDYSGRKEV